MLKALFAATTISLALGICPAFADEAGFLKSLPGNYSGKGTVKLRTNRKPISVTCNFAVSSTTTTLALDGKCRGLIIFSRSIGANLTVRGNRYTGSYIGAGTGPAGLAGSRRGQMLEFAVRWAKNVNGDRDATLRINRLGNAGLTLTTIDRDPSSGRNVVTSRIDLTRR